ncbi:hypothetical protein IV498_13635 [Paenarthrobacter sp. Z7-10]|uniref:AMIN-like domain-containing (lipo)protein n=1 Tax=Paenarthrobacter sp. Z7-10 TaxID=2787635 RepID=UPI0022A91BB4|nr:hypothetical protein [Paenarthrobacter sp. Z7-10]MCZ2404192.1 hypothetical protein [Paenarthrobacter sp. Z7-10]
MKKIRSWLAVIVLLASFGLVAPSSASAAPYCGITWGSLAKASSGQTSAPIVGVRAGQHPCYDRLVLDINGKHAGYDVRYVSHVYRQAKGDVVPLRGGAYLNITVHAPSFIPANRTDIVPVNGYRTFRQVAFAGSFEHVTTIGLGVRARLPFRVFTLDGPGGMSRLVIDVGHLW